jgi:3-hydroxyisobutyrate dehydrogenase-like beta-hydroxyacid dehydrogenase
MSDRPTVGFVGLGAMGARIASRLLDAGHPLVVSDVAPDAAEALRQRGATVAESPRAVADAAATVFVSLPTPAVVRTVALGPDGLAGGSAINTYVDLSTTGPAVAEEVAAGLLQAGVAAVDAPVSGGPAGAEAGRLTLMVAGPPEPVAAVRPLLEAFAGRLFVVGERAGQGQTAKVINNLLSASAIAITGEAMVLGVRAGLDPATLLDVVGASSGASNAAVDKFPKQVLTRRFDHGFRLALMAKDVRLALEEARRRQVPMLLGAAVSELWSLAEAREVGEDCTAIVRMFEEWGGAEVAPAPAP